MGKNLSKISDEHTKKLYVQINDLSPAYFVAPYIGPKKIVNNLNEQEKHLIKIYFDGQLVKSWPLDFNNYTLNSVIVWRSAGSWRMELNEEECT